MAYQIMTNQALANPGKSSAKRTILYGEGDAEVLAAQAVSIQKAGHQVETAVGRKGINEAVQKGKFDLVILDTPPSRNALEFLDAPRKLAGFLDERVISIFLPSFL